MMNTDRQPVVAIDGPAGSGKSTVARLAAQRTGLLFISSGAMYRAVALQALRQGVGAAERTRLIALAEALPISFFTGEDGTVHTCLAGEDVSDALHAPAVGQIASVIAMIPELRAHLVARQQEYGRQGGIIMEGRDIQTVVFPDADIKVFISASPEERARRRWKELTAAGEHTAYAQVLSEVRARDQRDADRDVSPLRPAPGAMLLNTDGKSIEQVTDLLVRQIEQWRGLGK